MNAFRFLIGLSFCLTLGHANAQERSVSSPVVVVIEGGSADGSEVCKLTVSRDMLSYFCKLGPSNVRTGVIVFAGGDSVVTYSTPKSWNQEEVAATQSPIRRRSQAPLEARLRSWPSLVP